MTTWTLGIGRQHAAEVRLRAAIFNARVWSIGPWVALARMPLVIRGGGHRL